MACIAAFLPLAVNAGSVYYVDFFGGVDTQAGSVSAPWQHCPGDVYTNVYHALNPGDTVIFKGGVLYTNSITNFWSGTAGSPITYDGNSAGTFGTGPAILDGQNRGNPNTQILVVISQQKYINWTNFVLQNAGGVNDASNNIVDYPYPPNSLPVIYGVGMNILDSSNITVGGCLFQRFGYWSNGLPNNQTVSQNGWGLGFHSCRDCVAISNAFTKICWVGLIIDAAGFPAQTMVSSNLLVANCDFEHYMVWCSSISICGNNAVLTSITESNCAFHDYPEMWAGNWTGGGEAPHCDGIVGGVTGSFTGCICTNINVVANNFYWNGTNGGGTAYLFLTDVGGNWNVFNNVVKNAYNGEGDFYVQDASWPGQYVTPLVLNFFNNTFYDGGASIWVRWTNPDNGTDPGLGKINIENNIFYATNTTQNAVSVLWHGSSNGPTVLDYNCYFNNSLWEWSHPGAIFDWVTNSGPWFTVPQLRALTNNYEAHGFYAEPLFASTLYGLGFLSSLNNVHLQSGSAAIGAGTNLSSFFTTDKDGNPRPATEPWTIGAYQTAAGGTNFHGLFLKRP